MKRCGLILCLLPALLGAEVVERIAVSLDRHIITESAIHRHLALEAFLKGSSIDLSIEARRAAAEALINQALVLNEMNLLRYPRPAVPEAAKYIADLRAARQMDEPAFVVELERYGFTLSELQDQIIWQLTLLQFVEFRFRPGIQVTDEELQQYYDTEIKAKQADAPPFDESRQALTRVVSELKVNEAMSAWLAQVRKSAHVKFYEEAFQ